MIPFANCIDADEKSFIGTGTDLILCIRSKSISYYKLLILSKRFKLTINSNSRSLLNFLAYLIASILNVTTCTIFDKYSTIIFDATCLRVMRLFTNVITLS